MMAIYCSAKIIHTIWRHSKCEFQAMENWFTDSKFYYYTIRVECVGVIHIFQKCAPHSWNFKFSPVNNNDWCSYIFAVLPAAAACYWWWWWCGWCWCYSYTIYIEWEWESSCDARRTELFHVFHSFLVTILLHCDENI